MHRLISERYMTCRGMVTAPSPRLTVGQEVEYQLLVPTEAGVVPEGRENPVAVLGGAGATMPAHTTCHSQGGAVPLVPNVDLHVSLLQQVPGRKEVRV